MTWQPVPNLPAYEYETHPASYGGHIVRARSKGTPTLLAAEHTKDDKWPTVAEALARCVAKIERVA